MSRKPATSGRSEFKGGLTMDITRAMLPTGSYLIPQPLNPTSSEQIASFIGQDVGTSGMHPMHSSIKTPEKSSLQPIASEGTMVSRTGPRARYVLPPGTVTKPTTANVAVPLVQSLLPSNAPQTCHSSQPSPLDVTQPSHDNPPVSPSVCMADTAAHLLSDPALYQTTTSLSAGEYLYQPVAAHWFYAVSVSGCQTWWPFSRFDSRRIENEGFRSYTTTPLSDGMLTEANGNDVVVPVDGGLYDVFVAKRERRSAYWQEAPSKICRSTWFYRLPDEARMMPFPESTCTFLEGRYKWTVEYGTWGQQFELSSHDQRGGNDLFVFHSPQSMVQYLAWPYCGRHSVHTYTNSETEVPSASASLLETTASEENSRVCQIRRGLDDQLLGQLDQGDLLPVDHVFFVIHGIGSVYNMKLQGLVNCVDELRKTAKKMAKVHFPHHSGRVEFLPVMWHDALHSDSTGVDEQLERITLRSIPKLRQFTNSTLTDILFYTSSKYCQVIVDTVAREICRLHDLFLSRNPTFKGVFSIIGHSLGAVIAFDLLANQLFSILGASTEPRVRATPKAAILTGGSEPTFTSVATATVAGAVADEVVTDIDLSDFADSSEGQTEIPCGGGVESNQLGVATGEVVDGWSLVNYQDAGCHRPDQPIVLHKLIDILSRAGLSQEQTRRVVDCWLSAENKKKETEISSFWIENKQSYKTDETTGGFGMPVVVYPQLGFRVAGLYLLGSPLPVFLTARGVRQLSSEYHLPNCPIFCNIFHPYDPVAYRMETIIEPTFQPRAILIPHHKGRKRLHLQLKDNLARMGSDIKSKIYHSVQSTWRSLQDFALSHRFIASPVANSMHGDETEDSTAINRFLYRLDMQPGDGDEASDQDGETTVFASQLNRGRRIDFVLQEAPLESFSDYLFALSSHAAYWESEDTALFLLSEAYSAQSGIVPVTSSGQDRTSGVDGISCQSTSNTLPTHLLPSHRTETVAAAVAASTSRITGPPNQPPQPPALVVCPPTTTTVAHSTISNQAWQSSSSDTAANSLTDSSFSESSMFSSPVPPSPVAASLQVSQPMMPPQLDQLSGIPRQPAVPNDGLLIPAYRHNRMRQPVLPATQPATALDLFQPTMKTLNDPTHHSTAASSAPYSSTLLNTMSSFRGQTSPTSLDPQGGLLVSHGPSPSQVPLSKLPTTFSHSFTPHS